MIHRSVVLLFSLTAASSLMLNGQAMSQGDPTHRPAPMYSKSEKKRMAKFRMVHGVVKDEQDNALNGALVNLKNMKTNHTLTFITKTDGKYMFDELSREEDYELSAAFSGKKTSVKKLSHFDPQTNSMRILSFGDPGDTLSVKSGK